jgi:hypothetical protein
MMQTTSYPKSLAILPGIFLAAALTANVSAQNAGDAARGKSLSSLIGLE